MLFRLSKRIWTYTLTLWQAHWYAHSGEQGRIEYTMSDILVPTLRNIHVYAHRVCMTMITQHPKRLKECKYLPAAEALNNSRNVQVKD